MYEGTVNETRDMPMYRWMDDDGGKLVNSIIDLPNSVSSQETDRHRGMWSDWTKS